MRSVAFESVAFVIAAAAFLYGAIRILKPGKPFYFCLFVYAAGCYSLEELWSIVNILCGIPGGGLVTVRLVAIFGSFCFMLSANAGQFDSIVSEQKKQSIKAGIISLVFPAVLCMIYVFYAAKRIGSESLKMIIVPFLTLLPAIPASYFSMKHLLLPMDGAGLLRATRPIDALSLAIYAINFFYLFDFVLESEAVFGITSIILSAATAMLMIFCEKGAKRWEDLT